MLDWRNLQNYKKVGPISDRRLRELLAAFRNGTLDLNRPWKLPKGRHPIIPYDQLHNAVSQISEVKGKAFGTEDVSNIL